MRNNHNDKKDKTNTSETYLLSFVSLCTIFCVSFLLALSATSTFLPTNPSSAAENAIVDVTVEVASAIGLTTSADSTGSTVSIPITPTGSGGTLGTNDLLVNVQTNNSTGYTLSMSSQTSDTSLAHTTTPTSNIPSTTAPLATPAPLPTGHWGYWRWEDGRATTPTTFSRIPGTMEDTLRTTTVPAPVSNTTLTFAANIDIMQAQGHYQSTVVFTATPNYVPPVIPIMQSFTAARCSALVLGETIQLEDSRDHKIYRVRKMADRRCWMIDNLAFSLLQGDTGTTPGPGAPTYSPAAQADSTPAGTPNLTPVASVAQYAINTSAYDIPNNGNPTPSYLYNWCASMGDTSASCATTVGYQALQPSAPQVGICPGPADASGFRLPTGGLAPTTPGNGTNQSTAAATTTNEFAKLDIWLGGTGIGRTNANTYPNFTSDNTTNPQFYWAGVLSGNYTASGLRDQGSIGFWWTSTANSSTDSHGIFINNSSATVYSSNFSGARNGEYAVRCIL